MTIKEISEFLFLSISGLCQILAYIMMLGHACKKVYLESINIEINSGKGTFRTRVRVSWVPGLWPHYMEIFFFFIFV